MAAQSWIGATLGNSYRIEALLGTGGMGAVYAASQLRTGQRYAVKLLHREAAEDASIYRRFVDEATIATRLNHPHIVSVSDFAEHSDGTPYIVMEFLEGQDLASRLRDGARLPLSEVLRLATQVCGALQASHDAGIVHRDIKPQNIFLTRDAGGSLAKVVDFGISKVRDRTTQLTGTDTIMGTPQYMSPEAAEAQNAQMDGRSDQFSLGVVLYQALSGVLPFQASTIAGILYQIVHAQPPSLAQLVPELPRHVPAAIARALAKSRDARFPSMSDFLAALTGAVPIDLPLPDTVVAPTPRSAAIAVPSGAGLSASGGVHPQSPVGRRAWLALVVVPLLLALGAGAWSALRRPAARVSAPAPGTDAAVSAPPRAAAPSSPSPTPQPLVPPTPTPPLPSAPEGSAATAPARSLPPPAKPPSSGPARPRPKVKVSAPTLPNSDPGL